MSVEFLTHIRLMAVFKYLLLRDGVKFQHMAAQKALDRHVATALRWYALVAVGYVVLIFLLPASKQSMRIYHLSATEYRLLFLAITLPTLVVWYMAFYGYSKLQAYAAKLGSSSESADFRRLARGCAWLAWSLPVPSIIAVILNAVANNHPAFKPTAIIIANYAGLAMPLIAFLILGAASQALITHATKARTNLNLRHSPPLVLAAILAIVMYCLLTLNRFAPHSWTNAHNSYFLPLWLMVVTVMVPYAYSWYIGLVAVRELGFFSKYSAGLLYRQPLKLLAYGLIAVIVSSIAFQYIGSVEPRVGHLLINHKLILQTIFKIIGGIGFILIALGAHRLQKIEEV